MGRKQLTVIILVFFQFSLFITPMQSFAQLQETTSPKVTECVEPLPEIKEMYEKLESRVDTLDSEKKGIAAELENIKQELKERSLLIEQLKEDIKAEAIKKDLKTDLGNKIKTLEEEKKDLEVEGHILTEKLKIAQNDLEKSVADKKDLESRYCFSALITLPSPALEQKIYLLNIEAVSVSSEKLRAAGRGMAIVDGGGAYDYPSSKLAPPIGVKVEIKTDSAPIFNTCKSIITSGIPEGKALYLIGKGYRKSFGVYELESLSSCELILEKDIFR